jgi:hypothetical protein
MLPPQPRLPSNDFLLSNGSTRCYRFENNNTLSTESVGIMSVCLCLRGGGLDAFPQVPPLLMPTIIEGPCSRHQLPDGTLECRPVYPSHFPAPPQPPHYPSYYPLE